MRLLSTKILSQNFRERILMHKFSLVEQAFIKISFLENPKLMGFLTVLFLPVKMQSMLFFFS